MMQRTLVGISDQDIQAPDTLSGVERVSRAELIRQAVSQYLDKFKPEPATNDAFGLWAQKNEDGRAHQQRLREEW